ncbi:hypothetical protein PVAP13_1KG203305 [Panicum virgatum]|uniref:Uncharacterized protein n=1 Tax=Panicum virgatum TaxID=38727 RepID=A0A8T0X7R7_PANVG|nr:hypothetical protein PVAP13_1KG203305 [Panicum virgatum]
MRLGSAESQKESGRGLAEQTGFNHHQKKKQGSIQADLPGPAFHSRRRPAQGQHPSRRRRRRRNGQGQRVRGGVCVHRGPSSSPSRFRAAFAAEGEAPAGGRGVPRGGRLHRRAGDLRHLPHAEPRLRHRPLPAARRLAGVPLRLPGPPRPHRGPPHVRGHAGPLQAAPAHRLRPGVPPGPRGAALRGAPRHRPVRAQAQPLFGT